MPTVSAFVEDTRQAYLNDPNKRRFKDVVTAPYILDGITALYATNRAPFYGKATEADIQALHALPPEQLQQKELTEIMCVSALPELRDRLWQKANATSKRGQAAGAPLAQAQLAADTPQ